MRTIEAGVVAGLLAQLAARGDRARLAGLAGTGGDLEHAPAGRVAVLLDEQQLAARQQRDERDRAGVAHHGAP